MSWHTSERGVPSLWMGGAPGRHAETHMAGGDRPRGRFGTKITASEDSASCWERARQGDWWGADRWHERMETHRRARYREDSELGEGGQHCGGARGWGWQGGRTRGDIPSHAQPVCARLRLYTAQRAALRPSSLMCGGAQPPLRRRLSGRGMSSGPLRC